MFLDLSFLIPDYAIALWDSKQASGRGQHLVLVEMGVLVTLPTHFFLRMLADFMGILSLKVQICTPCP